MSLVIDLRQPKKKSNIMEYIGGVLVVSLFFTTLLFGEMAFSPMSCSAVGQKTITCQN